LPSISSGAQTFILRKNYVLPSFSGIFSIKNSQFSKNLAAEEQAKRAE
jgi:hypothetical protein